MFGIGTGIGDRVKWFWINTTGRAHLLAGIEIEIQRLDVGMRVHVEIERGLRHADFDIRAEVSDVCPASGRARYKKRSRLLRQSLDDSSRSVP